MTTFELNLFDIWPFVYFGIVFVLFVLFLLRAQFKKSNIVISFFI